ncbi:MAG: hypothetical protein LH614_14285 [Pyrinomonadaceae bacterium]|nr:hypothetical protein [Pyrinomonadaceae bacterium]
MAYIYQIFVLIFLLQGFSLPFLMLLFRILQSRQERVGLKNIVFDNVSDLNRQEFERLKIVRKDELSSHQISEFVLNSTPHLKPLKCLNCSAGVLLRESETFCPHCSTHGDLPEDYAKAVALKAGNKKLLERAVEHWRAANILTFPRLNVVCIVLAILEPLLLAPVVVNGAYSFPNNSVEGLLAPLGNAAIGGIYSLSMLGVFIWVWIFLGFAFESAELRRKLPIAPILNETISERETTICQSCGGAIEYGGEDFACLCPYCNVENFRVRFTRVKGARHAEQKEQINFVLYGAMEIIEYYVTLFYGLMLVFALVPMLLGAIGLLVYALSNGLFGTSLVTIILIAGLVIGLLFTGTRADQTPLSLKI